MDNEELLGVLETIHHFDVSKYQHLFPVNGSEDSELLKMGIEFGPFQKGDKWRGANIPPGWRLERRGRELCICDVRQRVRAVVYRTNTTIRPVRRFRIGNDTRIARPDENALFCIWDASVEFPNKPKVVFSVAHTLPNKQQHSDIYNNRFEIYQKQFNTKAKQWLSERFPNWESHSSHWGEEDDIKEDKEDNKEESQEPSSKEGGASTTSEGSEDSGEAT